MATKYPLFLNAAQRAHYSKRRKEIWEALHPEPSVDYGREDGGEEDELEVGKVCPPQVYGHGGARPQTKSFAAETAAITGQSKRDINRNVARAEAIGDDLLRLTGTSLDKGVELDVAVLLTQTDYESVGVDPVSPMKITPKTHSPQNL